MKKLGLILSIVLFISCSEEETPDEEPVMEYTVTITDKCDQGGNLQKYCVSKETHDEVLEKWKSTAPERNCEPITFTDLDNTHVTGIIEAVGKNINACENL